MNFDDFWGLGDPAVIETKFRELLPDLSVDPSKSAQLLSQIALAQSTQQRIDEAHRTLDEAETLLTTETHLARVRVLLERGHVFQQAGNTIEAKRFFEQSYELSRPHGFDYHTINAAHMIAIMAESADEKIGWNELAIGLAEETNDPKARAWLGSLYNNLGHNFLELKRFDEALALFKKTLEYREQEGVQPNIRVAKWAIGRALRFLGRLNEALAVQNQLEEEYKAVLKDDATEYPGEMLKMLRGMVYEELTELHYAIAHNFARLAYQDLSKDLMFSKTEPVRLDRLRLLLSHA